MTARQFVAWCERNQIGYLEIADELHVHPVTVRRWRLNGTAPRHDARLAERFPYAVGEARAI